MKALPGIVSVSPPHFPGGRDIADFIKDTYRTAYGARIEVRYPLLMSVTDATGRLLAAIGFRYAAREPLFLEQYTDRPIEEFLRCERDRIVEIGNLAAVSGGVSLYLYLMLATYLRRKGVEYAVATGTRKLELRLRRIGLDPWVVCAADPARLQSTEDDWGTYYDTQPNVLAGRVDIGLASLKSAFGAAP